MKIAEAALSMDATSGHREVRNFENTVNFNQNQSNFAIANPSDFSARFSTLIQQHSRAECHTNTSCHTSSSVNDSRTASPGLSNEAIISNLGEAITGRPMTIRQEMQQTDGQEANGIGVNAQAQILSTATLTSRSTYYERSEIFMASSGFLTTEDGRRISFSMDISMVQTTTRVEQLSLTLPPLIDPIVLSFSSHIPSFSSSSFLFDLDNDGSCEDLSLPSSGCGFLAFDRNCDGEVNNGSELFGPVTGSGYGELQEWDSDANQWIDENDPIFSRLSVWMQNEDGGGELLSLKEAGVGAIAVQHCATPFQLQDNRGRLFGQIAASGLFLHEDGSVFPMQEVDLADNRVIQKSSSANTSESLFALREILQLQRLQARLFFARRRLRLQQDRFDPLQRIMMAMEQQRQRFTTGEDLPGRPSDPLLATILEKPFSENRSSTARFFDRWNQSMSSS